MNVTVSWDNQEKTVVLMRFVQHWTLAELDIAQAEIHKLMHPVDVLIDVSKNGIPPANSLGRFRELSKTKLVNQRFVVLIGANMFAQTMVQSIQRVTRSFVKDNEVHFASTREEAYTILNRLLTNYVSG
jgi:hypothetical protein